MRAKRLWKPLGHASRAQAGFSLVELLVTLVIIGEIMVGLAILFDSSTKLARDQTQLAELQQSLRVGQSEVVRFARAAGIGGLPITRLNLPPGEPNKDAPDYDLPGAFPRSGYAVSLRNNVGEGTIVELFHPSTSTAGTDEVLPGSDVLVFRGVFTTPIYYFDPPLDLRGWLTTGASDDLLNSSFDQEVVVPERVRIVGRDWEDYPQDLSVLSERLAAAKAANRAEAFILRDTLNPNAYAIMEFDHANTPETNFLPLPDCPSIPATAQYVPKCARFFLRLDPTSAPGDGYGPLMLGTSLVPSGGGISFEVTAGPPLVSVEFPTTIGSIGLLEEYRFFIRAEWEIPGDPTSRLTPVLSRARFLPGTDIQIERVDISDQVIDFQVAVGIDTDTPGTVPGYGQILDLGDSADEVLFNALGDTNGTSYTSPPAGATWYDQALEYHFLRINTLVQSRFPLRDYRAPVIAGIEDYNRGASFDLLGRSYDFNSEERYRRRWLQTVVELRNLQ